MPDPTHRARLEAEGWRRMILYDEPRLTELADQYRELGYEVHLEQFHPDEDQGCNPCLAEQAERYKTIYVRKSK